MSSSRIRREAYFLKIGDRVGDMDEIRTWNQCGWFANALAALNPPLVLTDEELDVLCGWRDVEFATHHHLHSFLTSLIHTLEHLQDTEVPHAQVA